MAIKGHYLTKDANNEAVINAALGELVAQQARVVALRAGRGDTYGVVGAMALLNRIEEVRAEVYEEHRGY